MPSVGLVRGQVDGAMKEREERSCIEGAERESISDKRWDLVDGMSTERLDGVLE